MMKKILKELGYILLVLVIAVVVFGVLFIGLMLDHTAV